MVNDWLYAVLVVLAIGPFLFLRYYPFRDALRMPVWALAGIHIILLAAEILLYLQVYHANGYVFFAHDFFLHDVFIVFYFVFSLCVIRMDVYRQLYLLFPLALYELAMVGVGMWAERILGGAAPKQPFLILDVATFLMLLLTFPFVLRFLRYAERLLGEKQAEFWKWGWVPAASFYFLEMLYALSPKQSPGMMVVSRIASFVAAVLYLLFQIWFLRIQRRRMMLRQNLRLSQELAKQRAETLVLLKDQEAQKETIFGQMEDIFDRLQEAAWAHDAGAVRRIAEEGRAAAARYAPHGAYCRQELADAILCVAEEKAEQRGIRTEIRVDLTGEFRMEDAELCVLLGNLIENAIEACAALPVNQRWMTIRMESDASRMDIFIENSCDAGSIRREGDIFYSSKRGYDAPSIGMSSIRDIAGKYHGSTEFRYKNGAFYAAVTLRKREPQADLNLLDREESPNIY